MNIKFKLISLIIIFLFPVIISAQQKIEVTEDSASMSKGDHMGFSVNIPQADHEVVVKEWSKAIRKNTKSKIEELGHEINITETHIHEVHHGSINLYSAIFKKDSSIKVIAFFEIDSVFFTFDEENPTIKNEKTYHGIKHFMRGFAVEQYQNAVQEELDNEEKILKDLNKEFDNLTKENENALKEIEENQQKINNSEDAIYTYETDNERKLDEINAKKESMTSFGGDKELLDQAKSQLKNLEKDKKNIENKLEKEKKNIVKYNANIDEANRLIMNNTETIEEIKVNIDEQEEVVKTVTTKLGGIE